MKTQIKLKNQFKTIKLLKKTIYGLNLNPYHKIFMIILSLKTNHHLNNCKAINQRFKLNFNPKIISFIIAPNPEIH